MVTLEHISALGRSEIGGLPERNEGGGHGRRGFEREVEDAAVEAAVQGKVVGKQRQVVIGVPAQEQHLEHATRASE